MPCYCDEDDNENRNGNDGMIITTSQVAELDIVKIRICAQRLQLEYEKDRRNTGVGYIQILCSFVRLQ